MNCSVRNILAVKAEITNLLSIDVEDYFHVSAFETVSPPDSWESRELRAEKNTEKLLDILEQKSVHATFFILGWIAERCPELVKKIVDNGHEIASHGYSHQRVCKLSRAEFRDDIRRSKDLLEDLSCCEVIGYRAPSYSISRETQWAFDELLEAGYRYDSSIFPVAHDLYGICDWPRFTAPIDKSQSGDWLPLNHGVQHISGLWEVPISTMSFGGRNVPISGGGYFRFFPYAFTRWGLKQINKKDRQPFVFYLHPWEIDPGQPKIKTNNLKSRFRHYINLDKTESRFGKLINHFNFTFIKDALPCL